MSFFKRHPPPPDSPDTDDEAEASIDPQLRLRTVRTAASTIAESVRVEERAARRKSHRARFFRRGTEKGAKGDHTASIRSQASAAPVAAPTEVPGLRRTVYVNMSLPAAELDANNEPLVRYERNKVRTSSE
jgi:phospholipid-translocating ATPase